MDFLNLQIDFLRTLNFLFSIFGSLLYLSNNRVFTPCKKPFREVFFWIFFVAIQIILIADLWMSNIIPISSFFHAIWLTLGLFFLSPWVIWERDQPIFRKILSLWPFLGLLSLFDDAFFGPLVFILGLLKSRFLTKDFECSQSPPCCHRSFFLTSFLLSLNSMFEYKSGFHTFLPLFFETIILFTFLTLSWKNLIKGWQTSVTTPLTERILAGKYTIPTFIVIIFLTGSLSHGIGMVAQNRLENDVKEQLKLISLVLSQQDIVQMTGTTEDLQKPAYQKLLKLLREIQFKLVKVQRIYILRRYLGKVIVYFDSKPEWSQDYRPPGTIIDFDLVNHPEAYRFGGQGVVSVTSSSDTRYVSILIPYRPIDNLPLILGMDIFLRDWIFQMRINKVFPLLLGFLLMFFMGLFAWIGRSAWIDRQRLRDSESKLRIAMESTDILLWTWPDDKGFDDDNPSSPPSSIFEWLKKIPFPHHKDAVMSLKRHLAGLSPDFEAVYPLTDSQGNVRWFLDRGKILERDHQGKPTRMAGVRLDITQRRLITERERNAERKLFEAQKLESLGVLASGVAHDFNNILTAVMGNIEIAELDMEHDPSQAKKHLGIAAHAVERAANLTKQMLAYAGKSPTRLKAVHLNNLIHDQIQLWQSTIKQSVQLIQDLQPIPAIQADPTHLEQILMNLILNANEAIGPKHGFIKISSTSKWLTSEEIKKFIHFDNPASGEYVIFSVEDNGPGIEPEVLKRIFEPFFSTKFTGRGLGLAAVFGLVRYYGGFIELWSKVGEGTKFSIGLPIMSKIKTT